MGVEARELMNDEWTLWQGHVVNGVYPLGRHLGCSDHSGVFATRSAASGDGQVAIKLIPAGQGQAEQLLPRWARVAGLRHPHLLPLLDSGTCQLDGLPYLYVVMEYADQTLSQLLQRRALAPEEARDMLPPMLDALTYLHAQGLVQGGLQPANVLVVGDQLKLASDTIRATGDSAPIPAAPSWYDPPEGQQASSSTKGDIWALGVSLFDALTHRSPASSAGPRHSVALPVDFPPEFREIVAACLSHKPQYRPNVMDLVAWTQGQPLQPLPQTGNLPLPSQPPAAQTSAPTPAPTDPAAQPPAVASAMAIPLPTAASHAPVPSVTASPTVAPENTPSERIAARAQKPASWGRLTLVAAAILALGWISVSSFNAHRAAKPVGDASATVNAPAASAPLATAPPPAAVPAAAATNGDDAIPHPAHEVLPVVPRSAARTIHGHVSVSVRASIDRNGSVSHVTVDRSASRYFQKLAVKAAKQWTFTPAPAATQRAVQIQFDFASDGATAHVVPAH